MKVTQLGGGLVGRTMAFDLSQMPQFEVTVVDGNAAALAPIGCFGNVQTIQADIRQTDVLQKIIADADLVIGAIPGDLGFQVLKQVIMVGKNIVDISFSPENPLQLDKLAKQNGVTAIVDCGVAPGCSNLFCGRAYSLLEKTNSFTCYVGGLPVIRQWPYEYKAPFSPADVLEEYTRPARLVENGKVVVYEALSDVELIDIPGIGTLEAFNSDGLRTLIDTMPIPDMTEKTLRYPGHAEKMKLFRHSGFFSKEPLEIDGKLISPLAMTSRLLFQQWQLEPNENEFTCMKIIVHGQLNKQRVIYEWNLLDRNNPQHAASSMARTTGYTATVTAGLLAAGVIDSVGIIPLELLGQDDTIFNGIIAGLAQRDVHYHFNVTVVADSN